MAELPDANCSVFMRALSQDRLVRYDAESIARTAVYDDEADYYTSAAWLSELEQEELRKRDEKRHEKLHGLVLGTCLPACLPACLPK